ncbi:MAG: c-type cytochrome [Chloroflexi bacterium]|nr:c-type cytochrome [Chloroflexota bacterium]
MLIRWQWIALVLSLILAGALAGLGWFESRPGWARYQREYIRLAADRPANEAATESRLEIRQIEIAALNRVDRCATCHLGATNPKMADAPLPFTTHPALLDSHPPEEYGCAICHGGEGRAVTTAEAHGEMPGQHGRLIPDALLPSACYACHGSDTLPPSDTAVVAEGIKLINEYKCLRCHQLDGVGGSIGPDLSAVASQRNWVEIYAHLLRPDALSPGSTMPDFGLRRGEATAIAAYLLTRLGPGERVTDVMYLVAEPALAGTPAPNEAVTSDIAPGDIVSENIAPGNIAPGDIASENIAPGDIASENIAPGNIAPTRRSYEAIAPGYDGRRLFEGLDCSVCHRVGLKGGEVGPDLTHIGRGREAAWLRDLLTDPARAFPDGQMPAYDLSEAQVKALVDYLVTLK